MPKISAENGMLVIELSMLERLQAGRNGLSLELWRVQGIGVDFGEGRAKLGTQQDGITAHTGAFTKRGERSFVFWPKKTQAVVVEILDPVWHWVVIGSKNAEQLAQTLQGAVRQAKV